MEPGEPGGSLAWKIDTQLVHGGLRHDVYSEVSYPPIASHRNLSEAERRQIGITEGCIRVSAGVEDAADILADFDQALAGLEA